MGVDPIVTREFSKGETMHRSIARAAAAAVTAASIASLFTLPGSSHADFVGLQIVDKTEELGADPTTHFVVELYAVFNEASDKLLAVDNAEIFATAPFVHHASDRAGSALPLSKQAYDASGSKLDTFVTVGFQFTGPTGNPDGPDAGTAGDLNPTQVDPAFCMKPFLTDGTIDNCDGLPDGDGAGWFIFSGPNVIAGVAGTYNDLKVLLGRFVVELNDQCVFIVVENIRITFQSPQTMQSVVTSLIADACPVLLPDCDNDGISDVFEIADDPSLDCNRNIMLDVCDVGSGQSEDANDNVIPDECEQSPVITGDLDGDGDVDGADLGLLLGTWGPAAPPPGGAQGGFADFDESGEVDGADLGVLLGAWTG